MPLEPLCYLLQLKRFGSDRLHWFKTNYSCLLLSPDCKPNKAGTRFENTDRQTDRHQDRQTDREKGNN